MKILEIRELDFSKRFYGTSEIEIIKHLNKVGNEAYLFAIGERTNNTSFTHYFNAPFGKASLFQLKMLTYIPFFVLSRDINIIITDQKSAFSTIFLLPLKFFKNIKLVLDIRTIPVERNYINRGEKWAMVYVKKYFDGVSYITSGVRNWINNKFRNHGMPSVIWGSGVNIELFNSKVKPIVIDLDNYNQHFKIFYHGSISKNRGIADLLDAISQLKRIKSNLLLMSLSDNNNFIEEYCKINNLDLKDNLLLFDSVENSKVASYIQLADICIVPLPRIDWWEVSSPLKLMEYVAMGKPVILSDIKAHKDILSDTEEFLVYYDPDYPDTLVNAINYAYENISELAIKARNKSAGIVEDKLSWKIQAYKLSFFLEKLTKEGH